MRKIALLHTAYRYRLRPWLHVKYNYFEIILKLFQCFILHVITAAERVLVSFQKLF